MSRSMSRCLSQRYTRLLHRTYPGAGERSLPRQVVSNVIRTHCRACFGHYRIVLLHSLQADKTLCGMPMPNQTDAKPLDNTWLDILPQELFTELNRYVSDISSEVNEWMSKCNCEKSV
jgi:hypothetical protein